MSGTWGQSKPRWERQAMSGRKVVSGHCWSCPRHVRPDLRRARCRSRRHTYGAVKIVRSGHVDSQLDELLFWMLANHS